MSIPYQQNNISGYGPQFTVPAGAYLAGYTITDPSIALAAGQIPADDPGIQLQMLQSGTWNTVLTFLNNLYTKVFMTGAQPDPAQAGVTTDAVCRWYAPGGPVLAAWVAPAILGGQQPRFHV